MIFVDQGQWKLGFVADGASGCNMHIWLRPVWLGLKEWNSRKEISMMVQGIHDDISNFHVLVSESSKWKLALRLTCLRSIGTRKSCSAILLRTIGFSCSSCGDSLVLRWASCSCFIGRAWVLAEIGVIQTRGFYWQVCQHINLVLDSWIRKGFVEHVFGS